MWGSILIAIKPFAKYVIVLVVILAVVLGLFRMGYRYGAAEMKERWDAAIAEQATRSANAVIVASESTNIVLASHAEAETSLEARIKPVDRKVVQYVATAKAICDIDPALVELFDAISRVPDDPERMPTADPSSGESVESSQAGIGTAEVLQAYAVAVEELAWLWTDYAALVEWERARYRLEKAEFAHE